MGIISTLKTILGLGSAAERGTEPTAVDHEPDAAAERAVTEPEPEFDAETDREPASDPTAEEEIEEPSSLDAEPSGTADESEPVADVDAGVEDDAGVPQGQAAELEEEVPDTDVSEAVANEPVDSITGIGPTYAERLGEVGVETVGDLLAADAQTLAAETDVSENRIQTWIDRARDR